MHWQWCNTTTVMHQCAVMTTSTGVNHKWGAQGAYTFQAYGTFFFKKFSSTYLDFKLPPPPYSTRQRWLPLFLFWVCVSFFFFFLYWLFLFIKNNVKRWASRCWQQEQGFTNGLLISTHDHLFRTNRPPFWLTITHLASLPAVSAHQWTGSCPGIFWSINFLRAKFIFLNDISHIFRGTYTSWAYMVHIFSSKFLLLMAATTTPSYSTQQHPTMTNGQLPSFNI